MINQGNNVPDKTIALFADTSEHPFVFNSFNNIITQPPKKRDWFSSYFYNCLPLTIGNQYGFMITANYSIDLLWDGENTFIDYHLDNELEPQLPNIVSRFGHGIVTLNLPMVLRTPPNINLMTINPPNYIIPNVTVMTGIVETDNLRAPFTFNIKLQIPNIKVHIPKGNPIAGFIPIPRYFADKFELKDANDIFEKTVVDEELKAIEEEGKRRIVANVTDNLDRDYFKGRDIYGNEFPDHQKP